MKGGGSFPDGQFLEGDDATDAREGDEDENYNLYPDAYFGEHKLISLYASACTQRSGPAVGG